jgi:hypothetical protein
LQTDTHCLLSHAISHPDEAPPQRRSRCDVSPVMWAWVPKLGPVQSVTFRQF